MSEASSLIPQVDRLAGVRVLVVGDAMLDRYVVGSVERISPEAPVPILLVEREFDRLGGAANVAGNVAALGGKAVLAALAGRRRRPASVGAAGFDDTVVDFAPMTLPPPPSAPHTKTEFRRLADPEATWLAWRCVAAHVEAYLLPLLPCTIVKTRLMASRQQMLRFDRENLVGRTPEEAARAASSGRPLGPLPLDAVGRAARRAVLEPLLGSCDVVLVSDYDKGMVDAELMDQLRTSGRLVVVDPRPCNASLYRGAYLITPNRREAMEMVGADPRGEVAPEELARRVADRFETRALVTLGERGMCLAGDQGAALLLPARAREVFDVTGAGDTVVATMALALGAGMPPEVGMRLANAAAQWVVGKVGTVSATPQHLRQALEMDV